MLDPTILSDELEKSLGIVALRRCPSQEEQAKVPLFTQGHQRLNKCILILSRTNEADTQDNRRIDGFSLSLKKTWINCVWDDPGASVQFLDVCLSVSAYADNAVGPAQNDILKRCGQAEIGPRFCLREFGDEAHVSVQRNDVWVAAKHGADSAIPFCSLTMDNVRPDFSELSANSENASKLARFEPPKARDNCRVIENILR